MSITIVRFEKEGVGIFRQSSKYYNHIIAKKTYDRHAMENFPTPYMEELDLYKDGQEWFCGYKSVEEFQLWVQKEEILFFVGEGFRILLLEVEEYQKGEKQVIFTKEFVTSSKDITSLFV